MGQTLSHGVYLPAEGERNCYSGLASNWNLLDTAIGDTAGKASATHTHGNISSDGKVGTAANKPLITGTNGVVQAGSFGNQANTFCEGNDSRLSDARTPVAHTHTKSDVTDLLNSNFIPSANNSYNLGSSSYQWNDLYANRIRQIDNFSSYVDVYQVLDSSNNRIVSFRITKGANKNTLGINVHDQNNSAPKGLVIENDLSNNIIITGGGTNNYLGTSTNKWKTLNGINPGALSLPNFSAEFDVSGQIVPPTGENQININWGRNTFTPSVNGWLSVRIHKATSIEIYRSIRSSYCAASRVESADDICVCSPVVAGVEYTIKIQATQFSPDYDHFRLSPCFGNV